MPGQACHDAALRMSSVSIVGRAGGGRMGFWNRDTKQSLDIRVALNAVEMQLSSLQYTVESLLLVRH